MNVVARELLLLVTPAPVLTMTSKSEFDSAFLAASSDRKVPYLQYADYLVDGAIVPWSGPLEKVSSPICRQDGGERIEIGALQFWLVQ